VKKILSFIVAFLFATSAFANTVTIVTSFPKDLTGKFKAAFEKKYPNIKVEIVGKKNNSWN
jgi:ABC-type glycerol-3-phosphate transport system substrate-binding protein